MLEMSCSTCILGVLARHFTEASNNWTNAEIVLEAAIDQASKGSDAEARVAHSIVLSPMKKNVPLRSMGWIVDGVVSAETCFSWHFLQTLNNVSAEAAGW